MKVPSTNLDLAHIAITNFQFKIHHSQEQYILFYRGLQGINDLKGLNLPPFASHHVGAGGIVVNPRLEMLLVKEKHGNRAGMWNIPMGLNDNTENVCDTALREVYEETGLKTEMTDLLFIRYGLSFYYLTIYLYIFAFFFFYSLIN